MRSLRASVVMVAGCALLVGTAGATGISSGIPYEISITVGGNTIGLGDLDYTYTPVYSDGQVVHGSYQLGADEVTPNGTLTDWVSSFDIDPQVTNNFTVTNTTLLPQVFTVTVTSPIAPVLPSSLMRGSIGLTITDQGPLDGGG